MWHKNTKASDRSAPPLNRIFNFVISDTVNIEVWRSRVTHQIWGPGLTLGMGLLLLQIKPADVNNWNALVQFGHFK